MPNPTLSPRIRGELYLRARGRCECRRTTCDHPVASLLSDQCTRRLIDWEAHRKVAGGEYVLSNLEALCGPCHKNTATYGIGSLLG